MPKYTSPLLSTHSLITHSGHTQRSAPSRLVFSSRLGLSNVVRGAHSSPPSASDTRTRVKLFIPHELYHFGVWTHNNDTKSVLYEYFTNTNIVQCSMLMDTWSVAQSQPPNCLFDCSAAVCIRPVHVYSKTIVHSTDCATGWISTSTVHVLCLVYALAGGRGLGARIADVDVNVVRADPIALLIGTRIGDRVAFSCLVSSVLFYSILVSFCMV